MTNKADDSVDFKLMEKVLHDIRNEQTLMRNEIREGFASMRKHFSALQSDHTFYETRLIRIEEELERLKKIVEFPDEDRP